MNLIDIAGSQFGGGAGRFRQQLLSEGRAGHAIGKEKQLNGRWLVEREYAARRGNRVVAGNNAGFLVAGDERWTLVRNANHFLSSEEAKRTWRLLPRTFRYQVPVVRNALKRSDVIVVPSTSMADRVARHVPSVKDRIVVRYHPLRPTERAQGAHPEILCPIVDSPYKSLSKRLSMLQKALGDRTDLTIVSTTHINKVPRYLAEDKRFYFVGILSHERLAEFQARATAIFYPTDVESFGYPLAEARASGIPVIAVDNSHNREIAGHALCGYSEAEVSSLASAIEKAATETVAADAGPFEPAAYFRWLLE